MLKVSSNKIARARKFRIVSKVNVVEVSGLEPPFIIPKPQEKLQSDELQDGETQQPQQPQTLEKDVNAHPFFWKLPGVRNFQQTPTEIRWIWNPQTGDMYVGTQVRHSIMTPTGTPGDAVLRGFYFPNKKQVAIRPFYWPDETYDQWDETHADLNADVQMTFIMAIKPTLEQQEPGITFETNINNNWLQWQTGKYSW